jgi:hypothetical protein
VYRERSLIRPLIVFLILLVLSVVALGTGWLLRSGPRVISVAKPPATARLALREGVCPTETPVTVEPGVLPDVTCYRLADAERLLHEAGYSRLAVADGRPNSPSAIVDALLSAPAGDGAKNDVITIVTLSQGFVTPSGGPAPVPHPTTSPSSGRPVVER